MTILLVCGALASMLGCEPIQRGLIYPARRYGHEAFEQRVHERYGPGALVLAPFDAVVIEPKIAPVTTAIWFHGNGNVNTDFARLAPEFSARGARLVLAEYPGYGARGGVPSERALVGDGKALYAAIAARFPRQPIIVIGQSLGSGVAAQVAADVDQPPTSRLVLATPFFDLPDAASNALWNLPVQSLVADRYDSAAALVRYEGPALVIVARKDRMVGAEGGRRLARLARPHGTTTLLELPKADHNEWLSAMSPAAWDEILAKPPAASSDHQP